MRRGGIAAIVAVFVGGILVQCGETKSTSSDTNTNWLQLCEQTTDCSDAFDCVSGVCTRPCTTQRDCDGVGAHAVCSSAVAQDGSACTRTCLTVSECPGASENWSCLQQECIPIADSPSTGGTGGASGDGGTAPTGGGGTAGTAGQSGADAPVGGRATGGSAGRSGTDAPVGGRATGGSAGRSGADGLAGSAGDGTGDSGGVGGDAGGSGTAGAAGQANAECGALSQAISTETSGAHACTAVVRLAYETREVLGFQLLCAPYASTDEATARQTAADDTGYGLDGTAVSGDDPSDEYVFVEQPTDFGGVGVVSVRSGVTVFGGSVVWAGTGEITYPSTWRPPSEIGPRCVPEVNALPPTARGVDLAVGEGGMDQTQVDAAMDRVWATALPDGMWLNQYVFDAMVLLYPRTVGAMNPLTAEWIVLVNFGWLE